MMENDASIIVKQKRCTDIPKRYAMAVLLSGGFFCVELLKNHLMTAYFLFSTRRHNLDGVNLQVEHPLSVYIYSYVLAKIASAIITGSLIHKFSANKIIGVAVAIISLMHMFIPLTVNGGKELYILICITLGLLEGPLYPFFYAFWRSWAPQPENTVLVTIGLSGIFIGRYLLPTPSLFDYSWTVGFYSYGGLGLCWCAWWLWWSSAEPMYPMVSWKELEYIKQHNQFGSASIVNFQTTNLKDIFKSLPVYALLIASFANGWNFEILDKTVSGTLVVNATHTGLASYAAIKYLMVGSMLITGLVSDILRRSRRLSTTMVRTVFVSGGLIGVSLILLTHVISSFNSNFINEILKIVCYCAYYLLQGFTLAGTVNFFKFQVLYSKKYLSKLMNL
ncbi:hypothetical protein CHUAL_005249 [Chamberlinius hualienensis]